MASDYNATIIEEFRATGGRPGGEWAGTPLILIHHVGSRSGIERVTPLGCLPLGEDRFAIIASSGGSPSHPAWYHNLKASPVITVEFGTRTFTVVAEELDDTARAELWPTLVAEFPTVGRYQAETARQIPVLILTRQDPPSPTSPGRGR
jgi:deazaflavin-dependent oxidoreductase (nitroreductase family)